MNQYTTISGVRLQILTLDQTGAGIGQDADGNTYHFNLTTKTLTPKSSTRGVTSTRLKMNRLTLNRPRMGM